MLRNTNVVGGIAESMVAGYLMSCGYEAFTADNGAARADLVYIKEHKTIKVQVKTANRFTRGKRTFEQCVLKRTHSASYSATEVDEFWVVGTHLWCFPFSIVGGLITISLGTDNPSPRKTIRDYDPNDFIIVKGSLELPYRDRLFKDSNTPFLPITTNSYSLNSLRKIARKDQCV